jgi:hypothetical protein
MIPPKLCFPKGSHEIENQILHGPFGIWLFNFFKSLSWGALNGWSTCKCPGLLKRPFSFFPRDRFGFDSSPFLTQKFTGPVPELTV